jgi:hypothetical protein
MRCFLVSLSVDSHGGVVDTQIMEDLISGVSERIVTSGLLSQVSHSLELSVVVIIICVVLGPHLEHISSISYNWSSKKEASSKSNKKKKKTLVSISARNKKRQGKRISKQ